MLEPLVLATKLPSHQGSPFSTPARDRAASAEQATDSHSLGSASQIDWNPIVQVELDNISSVESSRSTCQNQVVVSDLLTLETCRPLPDTCSAISPQALPIITPLLPHQWEEFSQHPDQRLVSYVVSGLTHGFHIGYQRQGCSRMSGKRNMVSAVQHPGPDQQYLASEQEAGRIAGPFREQEVPEVHVSRFGVIPKSGKPDEWHLILDLSFPPDKSVNDGIDQQLCSLRYPTVDQAVAHILRVGQGAVLAKVDVAHAFRNIPVHPDDAGHAVGGYHLN